MPQPEKLPSALRAGQAREALRVGQPVTCRQCGSWRSAHPSQGWGKREVGSGTILASWQPWRLRTFSLVTWGSLLRGERSWLEGAGSGSRALAGAPSELCGGASTFSNPKCRKTHSAWEGGHRNTWFQ